MSYLSSEAKEAVVLKAINRNGATLRSIAKSNNVGLSSLHRWLSCYRKDKPLSGKIKHAPQMVTLSRSERFQHILSTSHLDEVSLGKYCREHGLYSYQLTQWKDAFMKPQNNKKKQDQLSEIKTLKHENKRLQQDLRRKEKALAEASSLLILKKKADLIWGVSEDE